ncbi:MAG: creatininase family protein [Candidatus Neomarinimicrobiota bacterium]
MRPYLLAESHWKDIKERSIDLAILPWGAIEAHNYHLPYATDVIESDRLAAAAAEIAWQRGARLIVLPTVPYGVNTGQSDIRLVLNINPSTQAAILNDIIAVLDRQGIRKLLILNSHGGNDFKPLLRELGLKYPAMFLSCCNWYSALNKSDFFSNDGDHADEMETSLLLHLVPELALPLDQAGPGVERRSKITAIREGWAWSERKWSRVTDDTGIGDPRQATAEKGAAFYRAITEKLAQLFVEIVDADQDSLYE